MSNSSMTEFTVKVLTIEQLHKQGLTKFYTVKKCMNCFKTCEIDSKKCWNCNYGFYGEATKKEHEEMEPTANKGSE